MIKEYLQNSLEAGKETDLCRGWNYLKANVPTQLRAVLEKKEYWALDYNSQKTDFIIKEFNLSLSELEKKQLGSFVYLMNKKRREEAEAKKEQEILSKGYIKVLGTQKELAEKKVFGLFNLSHIGVLGSFNKLTELEGTLKWVERFNCLALLPKRNRTRGQLIKDFAYIRGGD